MRVLGVARKSGLPDKTWGNLCCSVCGNLAEEDQGHCCHLFLSSEVKGTSTKIYFMNCSCYFTYCNIRISVSDSLTDSGEKGWYQCQDLSVKKYNYDNNNISANSQCKLFLNSTLWFNLNLFTTTLSTTAFQQWSSVNFLAIISPFQLLW